MLFVDSLTEQTTAVTDAVLMVITLLGIYQLNRIRDGDLWKARLWILVLACLAVCALLGTVSHGFVIPAGPHAVLVHIIDAGLGLTVFLALAGAVYDGGGPAAARRIAPAVLAVGAVIFAVTLFIPATFLVFVLYEGAAMLFALGIYSWLAVRRALPGAGLMVIGILAMIVAAIAQTSDGLLVTLIWPFDHNGVFHLLQTVGAVFLVLGLNAALAFGASAPHPGSPKISANL